MIVPAYWAEGRLQHRGPDRQRTVRRFGWSDLSAEAAQAHADERAKEALERLLAGEPLPRRDPKVAYNGAAGVPIREEIVARHGETVITRNAYGALCLNTPDVLFVDVDFPSRPPLRWGFVSFLALMIIGAALVAALGLSKLGMLPVIVAALLLASPLAKATHRFVLRASGGAEGLARKRVRRFLAAHPAWSLRLYRTPAGLRLMATHAVFQSDDPAVQACFDALGADRVYAAMCRNQRCFRARLSPKPWRIGIQAHLKPRPGVWPVAAERLPARRAWVERYEAAAREYAACGFIESLGSGNVHPSALAVQQLHDELCGAHERKLLA